MFSNSQACVLCCRTVASQDLLRRCHGGSLAVSQALCGSLHPSSCVPWSRLPGACSLPQPLCSLRCAPGLEASLGPASGVDAPRLMAFWPGWLSVQGDGLVTGLRKQIFVTDSGLVYSDIVLSEPPGTRTSGVEARSAHGASEGRSASAAGPSAASTRPRHPCEIWAVKKSSGFLYIIREIHELILKMDLF